MYIYYSKSFSMATRLVTIKTFYYDHETLLYEPQLRSAGIYYMLKDHKTVTIDPFLSAALGGIKLQVKEDDVERAMALIKEIEKNQASGEEESEIYMEGKVLDKILEECPKCDSDKIYVERLAFLKSLFPSFSKRKYHCMDCKHLWEK